MLLMATCRFIRSLWQEVIQKLCDEMTASQQLSVLKEKLDPFPNDYLDQMVSEGVLSFDGKRYGFGHESFFDYCFARGLYGKRGIPDRVPVGI